MKRYLFIISILFAGLCQAQTDTTFDITFGNLSSGLSYLIGSDTTAFRTRSNALYQPTGSYMLPADTTLMQNYNLSRFQLKGNYLIYGDTTNFRTYSDLLYLRKVDTIAFRTYSDLKYEPALGFTPYNATNPAGYISNIDSAMLANALHFYPIPNNHVSTDTTLSANSDTLLVSQKAIRTYINTQINLILAQIISDTTAFRIYSNMLYQSVPVSSSATNITWTKFNANWNAFPNATNYYLTVGTTSGGSQILNQGSVGDTTTYRLTGLSQYTPYYYFIQAVVNGSTSGALNTISVITLPNPIAPIYDSLTTTSFKAEWNMQIGVSTYYLTVGTTNSGTDILNNYNVGNVSGYNVTGLSQATKYYFYIREIAYGDTNISPIDSVTTQFPSPTAIAATSIYNLGFTANWNSVATSTSYKINVGTTSGGTDILNGYNVGNVTAYTVTGLSQATIYYYTVSAVKNSVESLPSNIVSCTTKTYEPELVAFENHLSTQLSGTTYDTLNQFLYKLKDSLSLTHNVNNLHTRYDRLFLLWLPTQEAALMDIITDSTATAVNSPTYAPWIGYTGNGSNMCINTNYTPSTQRTIHTLNNSGLSVWIRTYSATSSDDIGGYNSDGSSFAFIAMSNSGGYGGINDGAYAISGAASNIFVSLMRTNSTTLVAYVNGYVSNTYTSNSVSIPSARYYIMGAGAYSVGNTTPNNYSSSQYSIATIHNSRTATEARGEYNCFNWLKTVIANGGGW